MSKSRWTHDCGGTNLTRESAKTLYEHIVVIMVENGCGHLSLGQITGAVLEEDSICFACLQNMVKHFAVEGAELRKDQPPDSDGNFAAVLSALSECAHACAVDRQRPLVVSRVMSKSFGPPAVRRA